MRQTRSLLCVFTAAMVCVLWWSTSGADFLDWIFADSFESGDGSAWSWSNGDFAVIPEAASEGEFGLRVPAIQGEPGWVEDENPWHETVVRSDFDLRADGIQMNDGEEFALYVGWVVDDTLAAFSLMVAQEAGQIGLRISALEDGGGTVSSPAAPLPGSGWHKIGIEFGAGTGIGARGEMRLYVDGEAVAELAGLDNDTVLVESLRLGVVGGVDAGTSGFVDIDVYTSVRLFDPWPCTRSSSGDPSNSSPVCLDAEGRSTGIATGGCGNSVVVWRGSEDLGKERSRLGGIYGSSVSSTKSRVGAPFLVVQDERAMTPDVGMDGACRPVVVWRTFLPEEAIFAGLFDVDGTPLVTPILVASSGGVESAPVVAVSAQGRFLVAWRRSIGPLQSIWGRFYDEFAAPLGQPFQIDQGGASPVSEPSVAMNGAGATVVVWESSGVVWGHLYDASGGSVGLVTLSSGPVDGEPAVGMMDDGGFVVTWKRALTGSQVFMNRFDPYGTPLAVAGRVDTLDPSDCSEPRVAVGPDAAFAIVWSSTFDGERSIRGRIFGPIGVPADEDFEVEHAGVVWIPVRPRVTLSDRLLVSYSNQAEIFFYARGAVIGARTPAHIFSDGFESGDESAWSLSVP